MNCCSLTRGLQGKSELQATCQGYGITFGSAMSRGDLIGLLKAYSDAGDWSKYCSYPHELGFVLMFFSFLTVYKPRRIESTKDNNLAPSRLKSHSAEMSF